MRTRLARLELVVASRPATELLDVVMVCPVADARGLAPGLYRVGPPGSTGGVFVYDPAAGEPGVPAEWLAGHALRIGGDARPGPEDWDSAVRLG
jgi:hypothetical protein